MVISLHFLRRIFISLLFSTILNFFLFILFIYLSEAKGVKVYRIYKVNLYKITKPKVRGEKREKIIKKPKIGVKKEPKDLYFPKPQIPKKEKEVIEAEVVNESKVSSSEGIIEEVSDSSEVSEGSVDLAPQIIEEEPKEEIFEPKDLDYTLRLLSYTPPTYPYSARIRGVEGKVLTKLLINKEGNVEEAEIIEEKPEGFGFASAVQAVIFNYKFTPPKVKSKGVKVYYILPIKFVLED
jgi:protein TonB